MNLRGSAALYVASSRWRVASIVTACTMIVLPVVMPSTMTAMLIASALGAGLALIALGTRVRPMDQIAWSLIGIGQLLNGFGNIGYAGETLWAPGWVLSSAFNTATLLTVVGMFALLGRPGRVRSLIGFTLDMLVILGCAFCIVWTLNLEHVITGDNAAQSVLGGFIVLAIVMDFAGLLLSPWLFLSRVGVGRLAVSLTVPALLVATIGDMNLPTRFFGATSEAASLC